MRFALKRDAYTPIAVLKAFVKIGLTLMPVEELAHFSEALDWIREPDHTKSLVKKWPVYWTFQPGPMPNDLLVVMLLRRKTSLMSVPYAFLVLAYGNDVFQVFLPSPKQDSAIHDRELALPAFPTPPSHNPELYGKKRVTLLDLCKRGVVRGEKVPIVLGFDEAELTDFRGKD